VYIIEPVVRCVLQVGRYVCYGLHGVTVSVGDSELLCHYYYLN